MFPSPHDLITRSHDLQQSLNYARHCAMSALLQKFDKAYPNRSFCIEFANCHPEAARTMAEELQRAGWNVFGSYIDRRKFEHWLLVTA